MPHPLSDSTAKPLDEWVDDRVTAAPSRVTVWRRLRDNAAVRFFSPFRPLLKGWLLSFLGWGSVAFILGANFVANTPMSWTGAIRPSLRDWLPWAILTPLELQAVMPGEHVAILADGQRIALTRSLREVEDRLRFA